MNRIVLAAAVAGVFTLSACGKEAQKPVPQADPAKPAETPVSAADKAAVDALGTNIEKLADTYLSSTGPKQAYAEKQLIAALKETGDAEAVATVAPRLPQMTEIRMKAVEASVRLRNKPSGPPK